MNNVAVILGAGNSTRMKSEKSKLLLEIDGKTVIRRTVETFDKLDSINKIIIVCREEDLEAFIQEAEVSDKICFTIGGATRQQSVYNAVKAIEDAGLILIHDGARPLIKTEDIIAAMNSAEEFGAAAVGVPVKDTIKIIDKSGFVSDTPDRSLLFAIQTPQVFSFIEYKSALEKAVSDGMDFTDDCQIIEYSGGRVKTVAGRYSNIKITTPDDIILAENYLKNEV